MKCQKRPCLKKILTLIIVGILLFSLSACGKKNTQKVNISKADKALQVNKKEKEKNAQTEQFDYLCKFTGEAIYQKDEHQVIAVMINNEPGAIPQSSLDQAEYLYEALIEGGATRIMAIYHHTYPKK